MDWYQLGTLIGVIVAVTGVVVWMVNKLDTDVKAMSSRMDSHGQRIDQLYCMFIDLVKQVK